MDELGLTKEQMKAWTTQYNRHQSKHAAERVPSRWECRICHRISLLALCRKQARRQQKIREGFAGIRRQNPQLSTQEFDSVFTTVSDRCVEHERFAFPKGFRLGATLMTEPAGKEAI